MNLWLSRANASDIALPFARLTFRIFPFWKIES